MSNPQGQQGASGSRSGNQGLPQQQQHQLSPFLGLAQAAHPPRFAPPPPSPSTAVPSGTSPQQQQQQQQQQLGRQQNPNAPPAAPQGQPYSFGLPTALNATAFGGFQQGYPPQFQGHHNPPPYQHHPHYAPYGAQGVAPGQYPSGVGGIPGGRGGVAWNHPHPPPGGGHNMTMNMKQQQPQQQQQQPSPMMQVQQQQQQQPFPMMQAQMQQQQQLRKMMQERQHPPKNSTAKKTTAPKEPQSAAVATAVEPAMAVTTANTDPSSAPSIPVAPPAVEPVPTVNSVAALDNKETKVTEAGVDDATASVKETTTSLEQEAGLTAEEDQEINPPTRPRKRPAAKTLIRRLSRATPTRAAAAAASTKIAPPAQKKAFPIHAKRSLPAKPKSKPVKKTSTSAKAPRPGGGGDGGPSNVEVFHGPPDEPLDGGWPAGWTKKIYERKGGGIQTKGRQDRYWFTPIQKYKLRSMVEVKRFIQELQTNGGNEQNAFVVIRKKK